MIVFWVILIAMLLLSIWFVVAPLLGKVKIADSDQNKQNILIAREQIKAITKEREDGELTETEYQLQYAELQKALVSNVIDADTLDSRDQSRLNYKWTLILALIVTPSIAIPTYYSLGKPDIVTAANASAPVGNETSHAKGAPSSIDEMIANLALKLKQNPDDIKGWHMLARSYMSLRRFNEAADVYAELYRRVGDEPSVLLSYADSLAMSRNGKISGLPFQLVLTALEKEPNNKTALWLAGLGYAEKEKYKKAILYWKKLLPMFAGDKKTQSKINNLIATANSKLTGTPMALVNKEPVSQDKAMTKPYVTVTVSLADEFKAKVKPNDLVFIYAKAMQGPPMPLAAVRKRVSDLPITVKLDDSMAMMPQMKLSSFPIVQIGARISKSGSPMGQAGDLQGLVSSVTVEAGANAKVIINSIK